MMDQQTWIITFNSDADEVNDQADSLEEFLLDAAPTIEVVQKPASEDTQGGWVNIVVMLITSSTAVALINAISTWIKSTHGANIDIEIKGTNVKIQNITSRNCKEILREVLKYPQNNSDGKQEQ